MVKKGKIFIKDAIELPTLLAITPQEQERGLMHKKWPPPIMSFIYKLPSINKFWMHNTPSPLDIVFCHNNIIVNICKGEPYSTALIGDDSFSDLVVEFPHGTCKDKNIKIGDSIILKYEDEDESESGHKENPYAIFIK